MKIEIAIFMLKNDQMVLLYSLNHIKSLAKEMSIRLRGSEVGGVLEYGWIDEFGHVDYKNAVLLYKKKLTFKPGI